MRGHAARRQLHRALGGLAALVVRGELLVGRLRPDLTRDETHLGEGNQIVDRGVDRDRLRELGSHTVDARRILVVARGPGPELRRPR
jgi:hypothetical protein